MNYKRIVFMLVIFIFLFSVSSAYAADVADAAVASEDAGIELTTTQNDVKTIENEKTINVTDNSEVLSASDDGETVVAENDLDVLSYSYSTFTGLSEEIGSGGNIELAHDYYFYSGNPGTISITVPGVIDGKGAIIDMNGSDIQAFSVKADGVTFKNLTIMNAHYKYEYSAAIYFEQSGELINCNFINNSAPGAYITGCRGGAVHFENSGTVTNCNFENNYAGYGGAIYFGKTATVKNCNFNNNTAEVYGGAIHFADGGKGNFENCNFTNNNAVMHNGGSIWVPYCNVKNCNFNNTRGRFGSAILIASDGNVTNCNFSNAVAYEDGGAIFVANKGKIANCNFDNCKGLEGFYGPRGGAIYFQGSGSLVNCNFTNCISRKGGAVFFVENGDVTGCNFDKGSVSDDGGAIYFNKTGRLTNCKFTNNKVTYGHGGAVYIAKNGNVTDCNFINNCLNQKETANSANGGALYMGSGNVENCNFENNKATATKSSGGAVYMNSGNVENCNFTHNIASSYGGAVYFKVDGEIANCNFADNKATASGSSGGAVYINEEGDIVNCNFTGNTVSFQGGAAFFNSAGEVTDCNFADNKATASGSSGGAVYFSKDSVVVDCNFTNNVASSQSGAAYFAEDGDVINCNFADNKAIASGSSGGAVHISNYGIVTNCTFNNNVAKDGNASAIWIYFGSTENCNFTNNVASYGAVYFSWKGYVINCSFIKNTASVSGGAAYFEYGGEVENCNFIDNEASNGGAILFTHEGILSNCDFDYNIASNEGGAVHMARGTLENCNFTDNKAATGGAAYIFVGTFENCNFINNSASIEGGAVYFYVDGNVANCNFTNNQATAINSHGGAISFFEKGDITNCNFVDNKAPGGYSWGGSVYFGDEGNVSNCIFTNNRGGYGGAIWFFEKGNVTNCNFTNNAGTYAAGAVYFREHAELTNSNFVGNVVYNEPYNQYYGGGAIESTGSANITNCNFTRNRAPIGSAIYFLSTSKNKSVSNSIFLDNRADSDSNPFRIVRNGNMVEITYVGKDNLLNAIYSANDPLASQDSEVTFTNVTYWGANGITNTGEYTIVTPRSYNEAGQNISVIVFVDDILILNTTEVTNENGAIILDIVAGNYKVTARHDTDSYYTKAEKTATFKTSGTKTSLNLNASGYIINATLTPNVTNVNILFVVKNESGVVKTVESPVNDDCIAELNVTGLGEGEYEIVATYRGNNQYHPCQSNMTYELVKLEPTVLIEAANITTDKAEIINITVNNATDKHVVVYFDKERYYVNNGTLTLTGLDEGLYSVRVFWSGDDYYRVGSNSTIFWAIRNVEYYVNVTDMTYIGKTANITAKSNIPNDILQGELVFTLPNGTKISANYNDDRTWWAIYRFDDYGDYYITASYSGLDGVTINNATINFKNPITISDMSSFYGDVVNVAADVHESFDGQNVTISVNESSKIVTVKNGKAEANFTNLSAGEYVVAVNYTGEIYDPAYASAKLTVNKINSTLEVDDVTLDYGKSDIITVITEGIIGITAKIDDTNASVINNVILIPNGLEVGNHILTVATIPDENHIGVTKTATITILPVKENTPISLNVSIVENYVNFTVNVNPNATGIVRFELSGTEEGIIYTDVINGVAVLENLFSAGDYTVVATYMGDDRFNTNATSESFTVRGHVKKDTPISAGADVNGNKVTITVNVDENATGFVNMKFAEAVFNVELNSGVGCFTVNLPANSYAIDVTYLGDYNFNQNSTRLSFTVEDPVKESTPISLDVNALENNATFTVNVNSGATGIVKFEISGVKEYVVYADVIKGIAVMEDVLLAGDYTVVANYMGDSRFNSNITSESFTIKGHVKKDTSISADAKINGNLVTITVNVDENATGFVGLKQADSTIYVAVEKGVATYVNKFEEGSYNVEVTYLGDDDFNENSTLLLFTVVEVAKENTTISVDVSSVEDYATFTVNVNPDATGIVRFEVSGAEEYTVYADVLNGKAVMVDVLSVGDYTVVATYMGDSRFNSNVTSKNFNIKGHVKIDTPISATADVNGYRVTVTVEVNESATGFVNMKFVDTEFNVAVDNGIGSLTVDLPANSYNVDVTYLGDDNFNENMTKLTFTVSDPVKENTPIGLDVSSVENNATFTVTLNPDATGIVRFEVTGAEEYTVYADVLNGKAVMEDVLAVGDYTVVANYMGDSRFNSNITSESFTIRGHAKKDTPISAEAKVNGNLVTITVNVDENATGFVGLKQAGSTIYVAVENGVATYANKFEAASYNVEVTYLGDDDFNENSTRLLFTVVEVAKENTTIGLDVSSTENNATFTVTLNPDATGIVRFEVTGAEEYIVYADVLNGKAVMEDVLSVGDYTVVATYMGDDRFNSNLTSKNFNIKGHVKIDTPITANVNVNGYRVTVTVEVNESATGFVNMKFVDTEFNVALVDGVGSLTVDLPANSYNVDVTYLGDDNFNENMTKLTFTVADPVKENTPISLDVSSVEDNVTFTVNVNPGATGIVRFEVSGAEEYTVYADVLNGKAVMEDVLSVGDYTVVATYMGDSNYNSNVTSQIFTVKGHVKKDTPISAEAKVNGNRVTITVNVDESAEGFVALKLSGSTIYVAVENGVAKYANTFATGSYNVAVTYTGDYNYNENSTRVLFTVVDADKENTPIGLNVSSVEDYVTFTVTVDSGATGIVRFEISGAEEYTVYADVLNGKAVMEDILSVGNYTVVATYIGDDNFNSNTTSASFAVEKEPVIIPKASEFSDVTIADDLSIYIVLKDETGNVIANAPINYVVNGTAGTTTTAADGSFTIKAVNGAKVDIRYAGNETILPTNITLTFNVPDVPVVVKTVTHFDIQGRAITIKGYAVDGPANEQGIYYATTLLDANGKPVSNVYMEFAVNNKIYNRTTYENGSFRPYKLNMIRAGRYTMAFNFAGDDNYTNAFACVCVDLDKKPITIKASKKTYKVATKTKKYTVTLSTIKGLDGKMYLSPKKVTLKVNGKTYTGKTNSKGKVTFKITNLKKKAKYKATITYKGDKTYEAATKSVTLTVK